MIKKGKKYRKRVTNSEYQKNFLELTLKLSLLFLGKEGGVTVPCNMLFTYVSEKVNAKCDKMTRLYSERECEKNVIH